MTQSRSLGNQSIRRPLNERPLPVRWRETSSDRDGREAVRQLMTGTDRERTGRFRSRSSIEPPDAGLRRALQPLHYWAPGLSGSALGSPRRHPQGRAHRPPTATAGNDNPIPEMTIPFAGPGMYCRRLWQVCPVGVCATGRLKGPVAPP
jgi:hypothetical protein